MLGSMLITGSGVLIPVDAASWRLYITANNVDGTSVPKDNAEVIEIIPILDDFSRSPFSGGSSFASSSYYGDNGANAFDGNEAVYWDSADGQTFPHTVGYHNPTSKTPLCFRISSQASNVAGFIQYAPKNFEIQYSLNGGTTWTKWAAYSNVLTQLNSGGGNYFWKQFLGGYFYQDGTYSDMPPAPPLKHEWLIKITDNNGGALTGAVNAKMALTAGGADQCTGGVPSFSTQYANSGNESAASLFDGSTATWWDTINRGFPCFFGYRWTSPKDIHEIKITGHISGVTDRNMKNMEIVYSAGASGWITAYAANNLSWTALEEKTFSW